MKLHTLETLYSNTKLKDNGCRIWKGSTTSNGYPNVKHNGRTIRVNRLVLHLFTGFDLNSKLESCHKCNNKLCIWQEHLYSGTHSDNMQDANKNGKRYPARIQTHCKRKHLLAGSNIRTYNGERFCITCEKIRRENRPG